MTNTPPYWNQFPGYPSPPNPPSASFSLPPTGSFPQYTTANSPPPPGTYSSTPPNPNANSSPYQVFPTSRSLPPMATPSACYSPPFLPQMQASYATGDSPPNSNANSPPYRGFPISPSLSPIATPSASYSPPFSPQIQVPYATGNPVANLQTMYSGPYSGQHSVTQPAPVVGYSNVINDPPQYPFPNTPVSIPAEYSLGNTTFQNTRNWEWLRPQNWVDGQDAHIIGRGRDGVVWRVHS